MPRERRKRSERRTKERRKFLTEKEFKKLIEEGKVIKNDQRGFAKRRAKKRRKRQVGL